MPREHVHDVTHRPIEPKVNRELIATTTILVNRLIPTSVIRKPFVNPNHINPAYKRV